MEQVKIHIAGEDRDVAELPRRKNAAWRERLQKELGPVMDFLETTESLDIQSVDQAVPILREALTGVNQGLDIALELIVNYMKADKPAADKIREDAFDSEILEALIQILSLAYPFGSVRPAMEQLIAIGRAT